MPTNATHRKRLARALAERQGISYLSALDMVTKAALARRLPSRLDDAGMAAALRILTESPTGSSADRPRLSTHVTVQQTLEALADRKRADDPRDQQIFDLSAVYEAWTGRQGLMYISSPGGGKDKYVFGDGSGGGHVCLGREEALTYIAGLVNNTTPPPLPSPSDIKPPPSNSGHDDPHDDADRFHLEKPYLLLLRQVWQGRVSLEVARTTGTSAVTYFAVDNTRVGDKQEIELNWLLANHYITHPPLVVGEEWALVKTTEFGDEVLNVHGADTDRFTDGLPTQRRTSPRTFTINHSDIARCPITSMSAEHYRDDGTCQCVPANGSAAPTTGREAKPGSNEAIRQELHRRALLSDRIAGWFKTQANAVPKPERWTWADAEGRKDSFSEIHVEYNDGVTRTMFVGDLPDANTVLDRNADRLMGGPYTTQVHDSRDRRVNATCDVCNRRLGFGEPWWMVHSQQRGWQNNAGVACGMHHPDRLPPRVEVLTVTDKAEMRRLEATGKWVAEGYSDDDTEFRLHARP